MGEIKTKEELRKELLRKKSKLGNRAEFDKAIFSKIIDMPEYQSADRIITYVSREDEIDTKELITHATAHGKQVYAPVLDKSWKLTFYTVDSLDSLVESKFGISEPDIQEEKQLENTGGVLCITPAIACDKSFNRLGFGKGCYDRFLAASDVISVCLCYEELLLSELPAEIFDVKVDIIATEKAIYRRS